MRVHIRKHVARSHTQRKGADVARKVSRDNDDGAPRLAALPETIVSDNVNSGKYGTTSVIRPLARGDTGK